MRIFVPILMALALAGTLAAQQTAATAPGATTSKPGDQTATQPQAPGNNQTAPAQANSLNQGDTATTSDNINPASPDQSTQTSANGSSANAVGNNAQAPSSQAAPQQPASTIVLPEDPRELAEAKRLFKSGTKLKSAGKLDAAFKKFERASELAPHNVEYLTAREFTRQELVMQALKEGNQAMLDNKEIIALAAFRRALEYDPTNEFALQRLRDAIPPDQDPSALNVRVIERSTPVSLQPTPKPHDFHFRGDQKTLLTELAQAYGLTAQFDDSVQFRRVRFDIENVNFATALEAAQRVTKTFWVPLSAKEILFVNDTAENRRNFERMSLRTFYLTDLSSDQELTEMVNSLRILLNLRYVAADRAESTISIRAEEPVAEAAQHLLQSLRGGRPEVLLDMRVYQISSTLLRQIGTLPPAQFIVFNISPALLAGLGQNAQNLINQLIASGGINQANAQAIQALLAQLQAQSSSSSILNTPFATFGGGKTLFGVSAPGGLTTNLQLNESDIRTLDHVTLRASQNTAAVLKVGQRYPIVNATFAPIYNNSAISRVIGNQSYVAPFPSFNFEDLGVDLKVTPIIHQDRDVSMKLELKIRSLGTQTVNGIPIINNREYTGNITAKNGESSVVTGLISKADSRSIVGLPELALTPGATYLTSNHTKNVEEDELFVVITPHVIRVADHTSFAVQLPPGH